MCAHSRKREMGVATVIRKEVLKDDEVASHKKYINLSRSLNKLYNPGNFKSE